MSSPRPKNRPAEERDKSIASLSVQNALRFDT